MYFTQKPRPELALSFSPSLFCAGVVFLRPSSGFLWKTEPFSAAWTQLVEDKTSRLEVQTWSAAFFFFSACSLSHLSQPSNQSLQGSVRPVGKPDTFPPLKLFSGLQRLWTLSTSTRSLRGLFFYGAATWETPNAKLIYLAAPLLLGFVR